MLSELEEALALAVLLVAGWFILCTHTEDKMILTSMLENTTRFTDLKPPEICNVRFEYDASSRIFTVSFTIDDRQTGGSEILSEETTVWLLRTPVGRERGKRFGVVQDIYDELTGSYYNMTVDWLTPVNDYLNRTFNYTVSGLVVISSATGVVDEWLSEKYSACKCHATLTIDPAHIIEGCRYFIVIFAIDELGNAKWVIYDVTGLIVPAACVNYARIEEGRLRFRIVTQAPRPIAKILIDVVKWRKGSKWPNGGSLENYESVLRLIEVERAKGGFAVRVYYHNGWCEEIFVPIGSSTTVEYSVTIEDTTYSGTVTISAPGAGEVVVEWDGSVHVSVSALGVYVEDESGMKSAVAVLAHSDDSARVSVRTLNIEGDPRIVPRPELGWMQEYYELHKGVYVPLVKTGREMYYPLFELTIPALGYNVTIPEIGFSLNSTVGGGLAIRRVEELWNLGRLTILVDGSPYLVIPLERWPALLAFVFDIIYALIVAFVMHAIRARRKSRIA